MRVEFEENLAGQCSRDELKPVQIRESNSILRPTASTLNGLVLKDRFLAPCVISPLRIASAHLVVHLRSVCVHGIAHLAVEQIRSTRGAMVTRLHQGVLIVSVVLSSWLGMQAVHESGHVLGAYLTGGRVAQVVLYPLTISRTNLIHNPCPLFVVWAGPLFGVLLPLLVWLVSAALRLPCVFVLRFFAGFCLITNGAYIAVGSFDHIGDCGEMLRHGSSLWHLWLFGVLAVPAGLRLWHQQGLHFGLGPSNGRVHVGVAYGSLVACLGLLVLAIAVGGE